MDIRTAAIIVAAGRGKRLGLKTPKALVPLAGRPLFLYSLNTFSRLPQITSLILVMPQGHNIPAGRLRKKFPKLSAVVSGGRERADSVKAGLAALPAGIDLVLVHDAARPLVDPGDIRSVIAAARRYGAAILAEPVADTIKRAEKGFVQATLNRRYLWRAQTPQGFRRQLLLRAHGLGSGGPPATDDSCLVEKLGHRVALVPATRPNPKITDRNDLEVVSCWLRDR